MNQKCLSTGSCTQCGCKTTALQMVRESCHGNCYPELMSEKDWIEFYYFQEPYQDWVLTLGLTDFLMYKGKIKWSGRLEKLT